MMRNAQKEDAKQIAPLLSVILRDIELPVFAQYKSDEELNNKIIPIIEGEESRYSYKNFYVYEQAGTILGFLCGYSGSDAARLDEPFKQYNASFNLPPDEVLFPDVETFPGEWYIDALVTSSEARGKGIGSALLNYANEVAAEAGETRIGLNCDQHNPKAGALYERVGFKTDGTLKIGDHMYNRMFRILPLRDDK